jgi:hypothetical protein
MHAMRQPLLLSLLLAVPLSSCGALLGVGAGIVISQEALDNDTFVAHIDRDADIVWATAKSSLSHQSPELMHVDEDLRRAEGVIDNADVTVSVEIYDMNRSVLRVSAKKYGVSNGEIAEMTLNKILRDLQESA